VFSSDSKYIVRVTKHVRTYDQGSLSLRFLLAGATLLLGCAFSDSRLKQLVPLFLFFEVGFHFCKRRFPLFVRLLANSACSLSAKKFLQSLSFCFQLLRLKFKRIDVLFHVDVYEVSKHGHFRRFRYRFHLCAPVLRGEGF
jgi:hypothetical protein